MKKVKRLKKQTWQLGITVLGLALIEVLTILLRTVHVGGSRQIYRSVGGFVSRTTLITLGGPGFILLPLLLVGMFFIAATLHLRGYVNGYDQMQVGAGVAPGKIFLHRVLTLEFWALLGVVVETLLTLTSLRMLAGERMLDFTIGHAGQILLYNVSLATLAVAAGSLIGTIFRGYITGLLMAAFMLFGAIAGWVRINIALAMRDTTSVITGNSLTNPEQALGVFIIGALILAAVFLAEGSALQHYSLFIETGRPTRSSAADVALGVILVTVLPLMLTSTGMNQQHPYMLVLAGMAVIAAVYSGVVYWWYRKW